VSAFQQHVEADRRLVILRLLVENRGEAGESAIQAGLSMWGHRTNVTRDVVRGDLKALKDRDCVELEYVQDRFMVARITERGRDVARGAISVAGVAEPSGG
jgi:DNA-binding transcriptional ArsR family regulator